MRWSQILAGASALMLVGVVAGAQPPPSASIAAAVERALPFLDRDGRAWMAGEWPIQDGKACVSCHQVPFGVWSQHEAARAGHDRFTAGRRALTRDAVDFVSDPDAARAVSLAGLMIGLGDAVNDAPWRDEVLAWTDTIARLQTRAGLWPAKGQFPSQRRPEPESDAVATMWMIFGLSRIDPLPAKLQRRRDRAVDWLRDTSEGISTEWWAWRLVVAHALGHDDEGRWRRGVWSRQAPDGGWSFRPGGAPSDPYTTGQVVYALRCAGVAADDPRLSRAVAWLLRRQAKDGTWATPSAAVTTAPTSRTDEVYRYWGTAWSVIGLSSLEHP